MGIEQGFDLIKPVFNEGGILGITWLMPLIIAIITMFLITRHVEDWTILLAPVLIGWSAAGLKINYVLFLISMFLFAIGSLTSKANLEALGAATLKISTGAKKAKVNKLPSLIRSIYDKQYRADLLLQKQINKYTEKSKWEKEKFGKEGLIGFYTKLFKQQNPKISKEELELKLSNLKSQKTMAKDVLNAYQNKINVKNRYENIKEDKIRYKILSNLEKSDRIRINNEKPNAIISKFEKNLFLGYPIRYTISNVTPVRNAIDTVTIIHPLPF